MPKFTCSICNKSYKNGTLVTVDGKSVCWNCYKKGGDIVPIKWSALRVSEAMDMAEEFVNQAAEPLEQAKIVAIEARKIANLPGYVDDRLVRILCEIERTIGGSRLEPIGRLRSGIKAVRESIPKEAVETDRAKLKHGTTQSLL